MTPPNILFIQITSDQSMCHTEKHQIFIFHVEYLALQKWSSSQICVNIPRQQFFFAFYLTVISKRVVSRTVRVLQSLKPSQPLQTPTLKAKCGTFPVATYAWTTRIVHSCGFVLWHKSGAWSRLYFSNSYKMALCKKKKTTRARESKMSTHCTGAIKS